MASKEEMFQILQRGQSPKFRARDERTAPKHPYWDAPLDSHRVWQNQPYEEETAQDTLDALIDANDLTSGDPTRTTNILIELMEELGPKILRNFIDAFTGKGLPVLNEPDPAWNDYLRERENPSSYPFEPKTTVFGQAGIQQRNKNKVNNR